ncbi:hypothetical protein FDECE_1883 [Fusarium decemcellulare]|nr:hypothetical protein FDECE_1883 [Fusarium decemcellulare]
MAQDEAANHDLVHLAESRLKFQDYPLNLVRTADFPYTLEAYNSKLTQDEETYFDDSQPSIITWDLVNAQDSGYVSRSAEDLAGLKDILSENTADPSRRFIFLRSITSRSPLDCSREMMAYLFTHHQVMARFLDFTSTFKLRELPHNFTSFKNEDYLNSSHHQPGLCDLGRSGIRIQHCFNLLGIEPSKDSAGSDIWVQRQIAAYHSFDPVQNRALWIVLKGNWAMRKRLESVTNDSAQKAGASLDTVEGAFFQTLKDHLLILQWCVENWDSYTEDLEANYRDFSGVAEHAPVQDMANDIKAMRTRDKIRAMMPTSHSVQQANGSAEPVQPGIIRKLTKRVTTGFSTVTQVVPPTPKVEHYKIEDLVQFDRLQSLSCLDTSLGEAISAIDQNQRVLAEIKEYYRGLVNSSSFKLHVSDEPTLEACKEAVSEFTMKIGRLEGDLGNYQGNLKTILRGVERTEAMYNGILQYQSMRTAEYFASSSEESAEIMQIWTKEMHKKTMSMHVITIFTLIFLPGTFVATIFSSGILTFGDDGSGGFGSAMGAWKQYPRLQHGVGEQWAKSWDAPAPSMYQYNMPRADRGCPLKAALSPNRRDAPLMISPLFLPSSITFQPTATPGPQTFKASTPVKKQIHTIKAAKLLSDKCHADTRPPTLPELPPTLHRSIDVAQQCRSDCRRTWTVEITVLCLERFWEDRSVAAVLRQHQVALPHTIVIESFLRIFSLLVYIDRVNRLDEFVERNLGDTAFPLEEPPQGWPDTPVHRELFKKIDKWQWIFFPVVFGQRKLYNQILGPRHILPIRIKDLMKPGDTVQVHKIEVHPACMDSGQTTLVRKSYDEQAKEEYEREIKTFNNLQSRPCDHIVGYYGSYRQRQHDGTLTYNLILEFVEGGNLEDFYASMNPPRFSSDTTRIWDAFSGVLEGLHHLNLSARDLDTQTIHQDIKPDNLLVSKRSSTQTYDIRLIIADFGYSHTKFVRTGQEQWGIDSHGGQTYGAPECSHHAHYTRAGRNHITPKADVWSLGCVMSETAAWMKLGREARDDYRLRRVAEVNKLEEFNQAGNSECFHDGAHALAAVQETHNLIRAIDPSDTVTLQVLYMIEAFMLVPQKDRQEAQTLREYLNKILQTAAFPDQRHSSSAVRRSLPGSGHTPFPPPQTPVQDRQSVATISNTVSPESRISDPPTIDTTPSSGGRLPATLPNKDGYFGPHPTPTRPARVDSCQLPQPPPTLSFEEASEWYENEKKPNSGVDPRVKRVISKLKSNVQGRDHIFFIENSETMGLCFKQIKDNFKILAYLAKKFDPDGVELYFSSEPARKHHADTTKLLARLAEQRWDQISFEDRIGTFIDEVVIPRLKSWRQKLRLAKTNPLTIFVMTDGHWGKGREAAAGVEGPIKRLIDEIISRKLSRTHVAFQFLRFGNDPDGKRYLAYLDQYGTQFGW